MFSLRLGCRVCDMHERYVHGQVEGSLHTLNLTLSLTLDFCLASLTRILDLTRRLYILPSPGRRGN